MEDNTILIGKKQVHSGATIGIVKNGGRFQVGNIIIEFIGQDSVFRTVQVYQQGIGAMPVKQTWVRTKKEKVIITKEVVKKPEQKKLTTTVTNEVIEL